MVPSLGKPQFQPLSEGSVEGKKMKKVLGLFFELGKLSHQTALAAGGVILVQNALRSSLIERADSFQGSPAGFFQAGANEAGAGFADKGAGNAHIIAIS
jgi:hypothetical protein